MRRDAIPSLRGGGNGNFMEKEKLKQDMKSYITAAALLVMSLPAVAKTGSDPAMDKFIDDLMGRDRKSVV